jgi:hypothetical protein
LKQPLELNSQPTSLAGHILPVSATMVGVCMTVISVVQIIPKNLVSPWVDALLALDNLMFLVSAVLSYVSLRRNDFDGRLERRADVIFLIALLVMVFAGFMLAFELFID